MARKFKSAVGLMLLFVGLIWPSLSTAESQVFENPTFGRARLDYCRYDRDDCGIRAALAFCRREGYREAVSYRGPVHVRRTMRVGNRTTCQGQRCRGFSEIVCERPDPEPEVNLLVPRIELPNQAIVVPTLDPAPTPAMRGDYIVPLPDRERQLTVVPQATPSLNSNLIARLTEPQIDGCESASPGPRTYSCTDFAGYHACQDMLRDGDVRDCWVEISSPGSIIQYQPPHPSTYSVTTTSDVTAVVYRNNRQSGLGQGHASWNVTFTAPDEYQNPGCDPNAPVVGFGGCLRQCVLKDLYTYNTRGATGGLFAIRRLDNCNSAVRTGKDPDEYDLYRSWEVCQAEDAWGGQATGELHLRLAPLYHMADPHTSHVGNTWTYENEADVIAPVINVTAPITITCVDN